jgi:hypothetical protein
MWCCVIGWMVCIVPEDRGAFVFKGKQSTIVSQIIRDQSPNNMASHRRMLESSAAPLWESQISIDMVLLEDVAEVSSFSLWFICWSYLPCRDRCRTCTFWTWAPHGCQWLLWHYCHCTKNVLTFKNLAVSLRTTRFNIQNFCMVLALR